MLVTMPEPIEVEVKDEQVKRLVTNIQKRLGNLKPAMRLIGEIVHESIQRNFEEGGRPKKWKRLAPSTIKQRKRIGKWPGRMLVRRGVSGGLMGAIAYRAFNDRVVSHANKIYAAIHHFGGMAGRGRKVKIPARPYMMVQDEDWKEIKAALNEFILGGV